MIPVSTHTPAISAAIAAPTFRGIAILHFVIHFSLTPLITTPHPQLPLSSKMPSQNPSPTSTSRSYFICQWQFFFVVVRQCWPSDQLPDCVLYGHVSRNRQSSKSVWRRSLSTMSVGSFELVRPSLGTSAPEKIRHWSICSTALLYGKSFTTSVDSGICGSWVSGVLSLIFFSIPLLFSFCVEWKVSSC